MRATPLPLPVADVIKTASVHDWLSRFAECVRAVDYAAARPFWHSDIVVCNGSLWPITDSTSRVPHYPGLHSRVIG
jgi:hypothetical protein